MSLISEIAPFQPQTEEDLKKSKAAVGRFLAIFKETVSENNCLEQAFTLALDACKKGQWEQLQKGENELSDLSTFWGKPLLNLAILHKEDEWVNQLVKHKIDLFSIDRMGNTPLHAAATTGLFNIIPGLIDFINEKNNEDKTPLHIAIEWGHVQFVKGLFTKKEKADPNLPLSIEGNLITPLGLSVIHGRRECIAILMEECPRPNTKFGSIGNILHLAIQYRQIDTLQYLLSKYPIFKELIEDRNNNHLTPLSFAAFLGEHEAIGVLRKYGASIEAQDLHERTPLHQAAMKGNFDALQLLYNLSAKINAQDNKSQRALNLATNRKCQVFLNRVGRQKERPTSKKNLVFKGGGVKGIGYIGALDEFQKQGFLEGVERVAGTSVGAITAGFIAVGCSVAKLNELLVNTNLMDFLDYPSPQQKLSAAYNLVTGSIFNTLFQTLKTCASLYFNPSLLITGPIKALYECTGVCEGKAMLEWLENNIALQTGISFFTLEDLAKGIQQGKNYKHIHVYGTKVGPNPEIIHISSEDPYWHSVILSDALLISMSIPGVFKPHDIHIKLKGIRVRASEMGSFVDGGMLMNFPLDTFDQKQFLTKENLGEEAGYPKYNIETLGFSLYSSLEKKPDAVDKVETVKDLLLGIANVYLNAEESYKQLAPYNKSRIIEIDVKEVGTMSFNMSEEAKIKLVESGRAAIISFIEESGIVKIPRFTRVLVEDFAFGSSIWEKHYGPIKNILPYPKDIDDFLRSTCEVYPDKKKYETHIIAFAPKIAFSEFRKKFPIFESEYKVESSTDQGYWFALLRGNVPGGENKTYQERCALLSKNGYAPPKLIEVAIGTLFDRLENNLFHYCETALSSNRWTQCQETLGDDQIAFGNADEKGIRIFPYPGTGLGGITGVIRF